MSTVNIKEVTKSNLDKGEGYLKTYLNDKVNLSQLFGVYTIISEIGGDVEQHTFYFAHEAIAAFTKYELSEKNYIFHRPSKSRKPQESLYSRIKEGKGLSDREQAELFHMLGKWCKPRRLFALKSALGNVENKGSSENHGIFHRVHLEDGGASYCAGQCYVSEIAVVRKLLTY